MRIVNFAAQQPRLAGAAIAAFTAVRQIEPGVSRRLEQRLIGRGLKAAAGRSGAESESADDARRFARPREPRSLSAARETP